MGEKTKRYTEQDYRQMVVDLENNLHHGMERVVIASPKLIEMVRQAAKCEEDFKSLTAGYKWKDSECETLKARLDSIVKVVEKALSGISCDACRSNCRRNDEIPECESFTMRCERQVYDAILRAARGKSENR